MFFSQHGSLHWRSGMMLTLIIVLLLAWSMVAPQHVFASPAKALHAQYDHSNPASNARLPSGEPPAQVQVWFTETIDPHFSDLKVYNQARQRVDLNDNHTSADSSSLLISLRPHLPDAAYTVVYSNISSEDGHHVVGAFSFVVGAGPLPANTDALLSHVQSGEGNVTFWSVGLRWFNYLGMALLLGTVAFVLLIWRPTFVSLQEHLGTAINRADVAVERRALRMIGASLLLLVASTLTFLVYQAAIASESAPWEIMSNGALSHLLFQSRFGVIWWARVVLLLLAGGVVLLSWRRLMWYVRRPRFLYRTMLFLSLVVMGTTSLEAHAAARSASWILLPLDLIHLACTGFWIGGVLCLVILLPASVHKLAPENGDRTRLLAALLPRFSLVAILSVVLLIITGTIQAVSEVGSWAALLESSYGQTLLVKIGLFLCLVALGAFHLLRIGPQIQTFVAAPHHQEELGAQQGRPEAATADKAQRIFGTSIKLEAVLAVCLLVVVGGLTSLSPPPPGTPVGGTNGGSAPLVYQGKMADLLYRLVVNPGKVGENTFEVVLKKSNGEPLTKVDAVHLRFTMLDMDMGTQELELIPVPQQPGQYRGSDTALGMSGHWKMTLLVSRTGFNDATAIIDCSLP